MNRALIPALIVAGASIAGCAQQPAPQPAAQAAPPLATQPSVAQEVGAVVQNEIEVTFAPGSAQLSPDATAKLDLATRLFRDVRPAAMFAIGYSDPSGDEFSNIILSARRALAVKRALMARGVPGNLLFIRAFGESDLADDQQPLARQNRRVLIKWQVI